MPPRFIEPMLALLTWTLRSLGRNLTDTVVMRRAHTLVTSGPYRWVRHPFYVSAALTTVSCAMVAANWFIFACGLALSTVMALRTRIEEAKLGEEIGDDYRRYTERTGACVPLSGAARRELRLLLGQR